MAIQLKHKFTSGKSDGADSTLVQPSNWNDEHDITLAAGKVLGRDTSGAGAAQELPISVDTSGNMSVAGIIESTTGGFKFPDSTIQTSAFSGAYADLTGTPTLATVATSGAYSDLSGTPTLATVATSGAYADLTGTPTLATVASSGAYADITGTPTLATVATSGAYSDLSGTPTLPTFPTGDIVGTTDTQTLTGKTVTTVALYETKVAVAASDIDLSTGSYFSKTISGATTFTVSNVPSSGTVGAFILDLTNGGSATVTWWSGVKWAAATAPTLTAAGRDVLAFFTHDGGITWSGFVLGLDVK